MAPMDRRTRRRLSKYLSLVLRHRPESAGLTLDSRGFCAIEDLLVAASRALGFTVTLGEIEDLARAPASPGEKRRFEIEGVYVRAGHGHSIVIAGYRSTVPTGRLFHATVRGALPAIRQQGLRSMRRQKVHLSHDAEITLEAARRRGADTVLIEVDIPRALEAGVQFYESADPRIVLADDIPPGCLAVVDSGRT
jgi:putative RNA 2'-phosphotransferase